MKTDITAVKYFRAGSLKVEVHPSSRQAGQAAATAAAEAIRELDRLGKGVNVIFATGASQLETLAALTFIPNVPWHNVHGFHLDEYIGIDENHPASFRRYLREKLTQRVPMKQFSEIEGNSPDPEMFCKRYAEELRLADPQLCLLGVGENGHLAFNDPAEADFNDPLAVKVVNLDTVCRQQQAAEGWFENLDAVPHQAITITIPTLFRVPKLIVSVPGNRKAQIVRKTIQDPISHDCPSTILRNHPDATMYLDPDSAGELSEVFPLN